MKKIILNCLNLHDVKCLHKKKLKISNKKKHQLIHYFA